MMTSEVLSWASAASGNSVRAADQQRAILEFAAELREKLDLARPDSDDERTQWAALDRIARVNAQALPGASMRKVALAVRLIRPVRAIEPPAMALPPGKRLVLLVREVPPAETPVISRRFSVKTIHVGAFLASAASVALAVCILVLKFVR